MRYRDALVVWTPDTDRVAVGPIKRDLDHDWADGYTRSGGAAYLVVSDGEDEPAALLHLFIEFNTIVVRDCVPAEKVHEAFLAIDEYRTHISVDTPGAEE